MFYYLLVYFLVPFRYVIDSLSNIIEYNCLWYWQADWLFAADEWDTATLLMLLILEYTLSPGLFVFDIFQLFSTPVDIIWNNSLYGYTLYLNPYLFVWPLNDLVVHYSLVSQLACCMTSQDPKYLYILQKYLGASLISLLEKHWVNASKGEWVVFPNRILIATSMISSWWSPLYQWKKTS